VGEEILGARASARRRRAPRRQKVRRERRMPARMPGRRPVMMAAMGKRGQVCGRAVGVALMGETMVEDSEEEVESAGDVDVEGGDVDDAEEVGVEDDGGSSFWSRFWMQIAFVPAPLQENPKGQQRPEPQFG
jgi:hypothetical protein